MGRYNVACLNSRPHDTDGVGFRIPDNHDVTRVNALAVLEFS